MDDKSGPLHLAQLCSIQEFIQYDFEGDDSTEVLAVGNFYLYRVQLGWSDASMERIAEIQKWVRHLPCEVGNNDTASIYEIAGNSSYPNRKESLIKFNS